MIQKLPPGISQHRTNYRNCVDLACRSRLLSRSSLRQCQNMTTNAVNGPNTSKIEPATSRQSSRMFITVPVILSSPSGRAPVFLHDDSRERSLFRQHLLVSIHPINPACGSNRSNSRLDDAAGPSDTYRIATCADRMNPHVVARRLIACPRCRTAELRRFRRLVRQ